MKLWQATAPREHLLYLVHISALSIRQLDSGGTFSPAKILLLLSFSITSAKPAEASALQSTRFDSTVKISYFKQHPSNQPTVQAAESENGNICKVLCLDVECGLEIWDGVGFWFTQLCDAFCWGPKRLSWIFWTRSQNLSIFASRTGQIWRPENIENQRGEPIHIAGCGPLRNLHWTLAPAGGLLSFCTIHSHAACSDIVNTWTVSTGSKHEAEFQSSMAYHPFLFLPSPIFQQSCLTDRYGVDQWQLAVACDCWNAHIFQGWRLASKKQMIHTRRKRNAGAKLINWDRHRAIRGWEHYCKIFSEDRARMIHIIPIGAGICADCSGLGGHSSMECRLWGVPGGNRRCLRLHSFG